MNDSMIWFMGVIESMDDPDRMNRVKVRCVGHHTEDKSLIPTADLPWAPVITNTSNMSAPNFVNGDWVIGFFLDGKKAQQPAVFGVIHGIPKEMRPASIGFSDPEGVYPNRLGEPTTPRNVNGTNINATNVAWQSSSCVRSVTTAKEGGEWDEPATAYNAVYPHNHAIQTPREHIIELDDTLGHERVLVFHRRGSFIEMHPNGEVVIRSMGNHSLVVHGDTNIYSSGDTNISAAGDVSVLANGDTNISTKGNANWKVGGNMRLDIGGNLDFAIKNDWNVGAAGAMRLVSSSSAFVQGTKLFLNSTPTTFFAGGAPNPTGSAKPPATLSVTDAPAFEGGAFEDDLGDDAAQSSRSTPPASTALPEGTSEGETSNPSAGAAAPIPTQAPSLDRANVLNTRIGKYYTVGDLVLPGHDILKPTPAGLTTETVVENLNALAINILDPLRDAGIKFNINSGFRQRKGASRSAEPDFGNHAYGYAVDLGFQGISSAWQGANKIYPIIGGRCSQFMLEYGSGSGWVHVTFVPPGKKMAPRAARIDKETWILSPFQRKQGLVDQRPNETKKYSGQA